MNVSQALEYERQPFIPMFIYGDHGAMESEPMHLRGIQVVPRFRSP